IGMGILPLKLPGGMDAAALGLRPDDRVRIDAGLAQIRDDLSVPVTILRNDEAIIRFTATAEVKTNLEFRQLEIGGVVPLILARSLERDAAENMALEIKVANQDTPNLGRF